MSGPYYLWIDFESDGYRDNHPEHVAVLEVGWSITDHSLISYAEGSSMFDPRIWPAPIYGDQSQAVRHLRLRAREIVRDMHDETGLWDDLIGCDDTIYEIEESLLADIEYAVPDGADLHLAGKGIGPFDVPLVKRLFPMVARRVHYAPIDISPMRRFHRDIVGKALPDAPTIEGTVHRALDDVKGAIAEAKTYRDHFRADPDLIW